MIANLLALAGIFSQLSLLALIILSKFLFIFFELSHF